jgi:hypothetical protein
MISRFGRDVIERAEGLAYCGFVTKPIAEGELYTSIRSLLHQHETDRRFRESEAVYRTLFHQSALPVWETDASGVLEYLRGPGAPPPHGMRAYLRNTRRPGTLSAPGRRTRGERRVPSSFSERREGKSSGGPFRRCSGTMHPRT